MSWYTYNVTPPQDFVGPITSGQTVVVTQPQARSITVYKAEPQWGVYDWAPGTPAPDKYYRATGEPTKTFEGTEFDVSGLVRVQENWVSLTLDEILAAKTSELEGYAQFVRDQSFRFDATFFVIYDQRARDRFNAAARFLADRHKDRVIGTDSALGVQPGDPAPTTYWSRDIAVRLIRESNGNQLATDVDEVNWGQVMKKAGLYDFAIDDAFVACANDIDAQYQASDRAALVAIDVTSAAYGWPEYYQGPVSAGIRVV